MVYGKKYTVADFMIDLHENVHYLIEDLFPIDKKKNFAKQARDKDDLADSLYNTLLAKAQESIDIYMRDNLFPSLDLRELSINFKNPTAPTQRS